jgi:hypothetical protein
MKIEWKKEKKKNRQDRRRGQTDGQTDPEIGEGDLTYAAALQFGWFLVFSYSYSHNLLTE